MEQMLSEYFKLTLAGELTNALFLAIIFGLIIFDLRKYLAIEKLFEKLKIKTLFIKIPLVLIYYIVLIEISLLGVIGIVAILFLIEKVL